MWFHVKNAPGSHVIVRAASVPGGRIPDSTIEEAAGIAAWYSSVKNSTAVDVDYTTIKNVKKPSGAKPGMVIGKNGAEIEKLRATCQAKLGKPVTINIVEIKNPDANAQLVAENIAAQLEKRISFRRAMKLSIGRAMRLGVKGIKTQVSGRLGGAEIARSEQYHEGTIPLQTLRADIDYGFAEANTTYGIIGVKVWIYRGEVLNENRRTNKRQGGSR